MAGPTARLCHRRAQLLRRLFPYDLQSAGAILPLRWKVFAFCFGFVFLSFVFFSSYPGADGSTDVRWGFVGLPDSQVDALIRFLEENADLISSLLSHQQQEMSPGTGSIVSDASSGQLFPSSSMSLLPFFLFFLFYLSFIFSVSPSVFHHFACFYSCSIFHLANFPFSFLEH